VAVTTAMTAVAAEVAANNFKIKGKHSYE